MREPCRCAWGTFVRTESFYPKIFVSSRHDPLRTSHSTSSSVRLSHISDGNLEENNDSQSQQRLCRSCVTRMGGEVRGRWDENGCGRQENVGGNLGGLLGPGALADQLPKDSGPHGVRNRVIRLINPRHVIGGDSSSILRRLPPTFLRFFCSCLGSVPERASSPPVQYPALVSCI